MTAVEFVFLTPVVFMIMMATVQFSIYLFAKQAAQSAVREGDRVARQEAGGADCMSPNAKWRADAQQRTSDRAAGISGSLLTFNASSDITTTATPDSTVAAACQATVTVDFQAKVPAILPWMPTTVHVTASGPVEQFVRHG